MSGLLRGTDLPQVRMGQALPIPQDSIVMGFIAKYLWPD